MNKKIVLSIVFLAILIITSIAFFNPVRADSVTILSSSGWTDSLGNYMITGEVQNTGSTTVSYVKVSATIYESSNTVVDTQDAYALLIYMQPNTKSPFIILDTQTTLVPQFDHYNLQVSSTNGGSIQQGLQITSQSSHTDSIGYFHVVGNVQNTGTATSSNTQVYATFYDSSGMVVDVASTYADQDSLASGSTSPFTIDCIDLNRVPLIASYSLTAQSSDYALVSASQATATPTSTQTSQTSNPTATPTVPEFPTWIILPLFAVAILLSTVFIRKRIPKK